MQTATRIYLDFLYNIFSSLFLYTLVRQNVKMKNKKYVLCFMIVSIFLFSIPEEIPYGSLCATILDILYIILLCYPNLRKMPFIFIKYKFVFTIVYFGILLLHSLILSDFSSVVDNPYYIQCKDLICTSILYIFYILYINTKRAKKYHSHYQYLFNLIIILISVSLSYLTLFICKSDHSNSPVIPVFFSAIYLLIMACIFVYGKFIDLLKENTLSHIQLEKYKLDEQYSLQIDENLKTLRSLRHDMKNHLITISGYALQNNCEKIQNYIEQITGHFSQTYIIETPSQTVSALLNTKYQEAEQKKLHCKFHCDFPYLHIGDYEMITILGNLLDNAITAASKCENGNLFLSISQLDSYLQIQINNTHIEDIQESDGIFQTTKKDTNAFHGIGIKNVRSTILKLNGQIDISYTKDEFHVVILIPNYSNQTLT